MSHWRHVTQASMPLQPARYQAIAGHLQRDQQRGLLTLRGPDLAYFLAFAPPGDPLREWVLDRLTARIAAADAARLHGASPAARHVCPNCSGTGCRACAERALVCPTCRGARWLAEHDPTDYAPGTPIALARCPDCTAPGPDGRVYDPRVEAAAIQAYLSGLRGT